MDFLAPPRDAYQNVITLSEVKPTEYSFLFHWSVDGVSWDVLLLASHECCNEPKFLWLFSLVGTSTT